MQKLEIMKYLTGKSEFKRLKKSLDTLMPEDAKQVRAALRLRNPLIMLCVLKLFDWIGKHKRSCVLNDLVNN